MKTTWYKTCLTTALVAGFVGLGVSGCDLKSRSVESHHEKAPATATRAPADDKTTEAVSEKKTEVAETTATSDPAPSRTHPQRVRCITRTVMRSRRQELPRCVRVTPGTVQNWIVMAMGLPAKSRAGGGAPRGTPDSHPADFVTRISLRRALRRCITSFPPVPKWSCSLRYSRYRSS